MATIRALWDSGGELVNRDSPFFPLRNAVFELPPYRGSSFRDLIAAHGPRMLRAAGATATPIPAFPHQPKDYAQRLEVVRTAASDAGRDPKAVLPAVMLFVVTGRSRDDVDAALDTEVLKSFALNASGRDVRPPRRTSPGSGFPVRRTSSPHSIDEEQAFSHRRGPAVADAGHLPERHTGRTPRTGG